MAIDHNGYSFPVAYHSEPLVAPFERPIAVQTWWSVTGAYILLGRNQVREINCEVTFANYATLALLNADINAVSAQLNSGLTGTLTIDSQSYPLSTFLGFNPGEPPFLDGSGQHGWVQRGVLAWLQASS